MQLHVEHATAEEKAGRDYFAALSRDPIVCSGAMLFGAGHVASRLASALASPSPENFTEWASRRPSVACDVSVKSSCGNAVSD
jgi:hypothetical protein